MDNREAQAALSNIHKFILQFVKPLVELEPYLASMGKVVSDVNVYTDKIDVAKTQHQAINNDIEDALVSLGKTQSDLSDAKQTLAEINNLISGASGQHQTVIDKLNLEYSNLRKTLEEQHQVNVSILTNDIAVLEAKRMALKDALTSDIDKVNKITHA